MPPNTSQLPKSQRTLACVRCQQRKTRCDRKFPCANCTSASVSCVPATLTTRRRRRFPERELLEKLRRYEDLLRQNQINFEPLHPNSTENREKDGSDDEQAEETGMGGGSSPTTFRESQERLDQDSDSSLGEVRKVVVKTAWSQMFGDNDHLLFGAPQTNVDLSTLHPQPVQIFRLWQLYLDNVNPLLKVTHTPSLQGRIIEAASHVSNIEPPLEALMFSIYCIALVSLDDNAHHCLVSFGSPIEDLLTRFQFGCRQALQNCGFLRTNDRDCLTALCLYLMSVRPNTVPQSLSAMLGVAIRIAQRMGINNEPCLARCSVLDAELRRRLWWALVLFDTRIAELADYKTETLVNTWDCGVPLNVNDSDIRLEMKEPPEVQEKSTDSIFVVVRGELGEFVRSSMSHLDFTSLARKPVPTPQTRHSIPRPDIGRIEKIIEEKYLRYCNADDNPLHFMTIWWTREFIARCRLVDLHSRLSSSSVSQIDDQRDTTMSLALEMLECDTQFMTSPHAKGFLWLIFYHRPLPAFVQVVQDLKRRPTSKHAERAWDVASKNHEARSRFMYNDGNPFFTMFANLILQAWDARLANYGLVGEHTIPPTIVSSIQKKVALIEQQRAQHDDTKPPMNLMNLSIGSFPAPSTAMNLENQEPIYGDRGPPASEYNSILPGEYSSMFGDTIWNTDSNNIDWNSMDLGFPPLTVDSTTTFF